MIKTVLLLSLAAICSSKSLSSKQIRFFKKHVEDWSAPAIEKVLGGESEVHEGVKEMNIEYKSEDDKICKAFYTKSKKGESSTRWSCTAIQKYEDDSSISDRYD
ncbi:hypothetical protein GE061_007394 [Apolygus lucorum]|uniref:Cathepsin propeptide inhibitor domain-containing protein n=1 Tax=Apolygus lucorum TaxID=248454 RepID=A0A8S9WTG7_APOLU|nr:hypothetical protein GE061_007394 [Apolygus lucorum]